MITDEMLAEWEQQLYPLFDDEEVNRWCHCAEVATYEVGHE